MKNMDVTLNALIYEGAATNDPADAIKVFGRINETALQGAVRLELPVAASTVDAPIQLPSANCLYLIILTDQPISIKLNGGSESVALQPRGVGSKTLAYFHRGALTGLSVTNATTLQANVDIIIATK